MGDWVMSWAWCLPCGFQSPLPYFYVIYFAILLVHRQTRDDEACAHKCVGSPPPRSSAREGSRPTDGLTRVVPPTHQHRYKKDWETYKKLVPWRCVDSVPLSP